MEWYTINRVFIEGIIAEWLRPIAGRGLCPTVGDDRHRLHWRGRYRTLATPEEVSVIRGAIMLHYAVVFFIIALIAAVFGFGGIAVGAAGIAKVLFIVFLIGAVVSFLMSMGRRA
jgi:uncharacterized membrane protein YtjA (UPF0391 family)